MTLPVFNESHRYFFHFIISKEDEVAFKAYVEVFPINYWRRAINIYQDKSTSLYKITDGLNCHEIFKHEFLKE
ncbi:hypothetical protein SMN_1845 [Sulfurospirillum multivorans]|uniref:Uncharacterized protein n=1 Tax=Sulfurospirillum multivorans TaxID=66821 RepID=A0ABX5Z581_SULMU|nr:hypothetical protein SMN_1845 [Sulfurospirillum multivorans]